MSANKDRILTRDVEASQIPSGDKLTLSAGSKVFITQTLGGSFTEIGRASCRERVLVQV